MGERSECRVRIDQFLKELGIGVTLQPGWKNALDDDDDDDDDEVEEVTPSSAEATVAAAAIFSLLSSSGGGFGFS